MATFGGTTFGERPQGPMFPRFAREAVYSLTKTGATKVVLQTNGTSADKLTLEAYCTAAQLDDLYDQVGDVATLVWGGGTRSAFLAKITPAEVGVHDVFFVTLEFVGR